MKKLNEEENEEFFQEEYFTFQSPNLGKKKILEFFLVQVMHLFSI